MSAEILRRAAALMMRENAAAAMPGDWEVYETFTHRCIGVTRHVRRRQVAQATEAHPGSADHIASWDPPVALAVADWLDGLVDRHTRPVGGEVIGLDTYEATFALAVATAYLGATP